MSPVSSSKKKSLNNASESAPQVSCEDLMCALMSTAKMIHRFGEAKISKHKHLSKLSGPRIGVIFAVHEAGTIRMGDLAAKMLVAPRTATDLVDGLERDGYLQRLPDPADRRAMLLELTPKASADFGNIAALRKAFTEEVFGHLSADDRYQLVQLLNKVKQGSLSQLMKNQLVNDGPKICD